jgi:tRNA(fMet)-specific endonuclease VapC
MLKASMEKSGMRLDDFDLIIAACALAYNLTLVTNNSKQFSRIEGLKITNWSLNPEKNA